MREGPLSELVLLVEGEAGSTMVGAKSMLVPASEETSMVLAVARSSRSRTPNSLLLFTAATGLRLALDEAADSEPDV